MHEREAQEWRAGPPYPLVGQGWQQDGLAALARRSAGTGARRRRTGADCAPVARQLGAFSVFGVGLSQLSARPKRLFLVQGQLGKAGLLLDKTEAPLELAIRVAQSCFRFDVKMPCEVHD